MNSLYVVLSSAAVSSALSGLLLFLFKDLISARLKAVIEHEYAQKLETHKAQLQAQNEIAISKYAHELETHKASLDAQNKTAIALLQSQLEIAAAERSVRFSKVFDTTAETIVEIYRKLLLLNAATFEYTNAISGTNDKATAEANQNLQEQTIAFESYFQRNRIYVPKTSGNRVWEFFNALRSAKVAYSMAMTAVQARSPSSDRLFDKYQTTIDKIPAMTEMLHDEFQKLLGFANANSKKPSANGSETGITPIE